MRRLILTLLVPAACITLQADTSGRISGKIVNKEGKPLAGAKINLKRLDRNWSKDLVTDKSGNFLQVGLEPKEFDLTISAEGYSDYKEQIKIPLGDVLPMNVTMLTPGETRAKALASGTVPAVSTDPGAILDADGRDAFNTAIPLYNQGNFDEALPHLEKA